MSEEYITKTQVRELMERYYENANLRQDHFLRSVFRDIKALPAADVVEVVHGSPVKVFEDPLTGKMFTTCSRCDGKISPKDKWCKHCGAKMDGGADGKRKDGADNAVD